MDQTDDEEGATLLECKTSLPSVSLNDGLAVATYCSGVHNWRLLLRLSVLRVRGRVALLCRCWVLSGRHGLSLHVLWNAHSESSADELIERSTLVLGLVKQPRILSCLLLNFAQQLLNEIQVPRTERGAATLNVLLRHRSGLRVAAHSWGGTAHHQATTGTETPIGEEKGL